MLNKGFMLTDILITLIILGVISSLSLNVKYKHQYDKKDTMSLALNEIINAKRESLLNVEKNCISPSSITSSHIICFNNKGNVNQAQSLNILFNDRKIVLHLGSGIYEIQ